MSLRITPQGLGLGGTVTGNLVITGTLDVTGVVTFSAAQSVEGILTLGETLVSAVDMIRLKGADLTGDGTQDSHGFVLSGMSFAEGGPVTVRDWRQRATSAAWILESQTGGGGYSEFVKVSSAGMETTKLIVDVDNSAALDVRKDGGGTSVFSVDTSVPTVRIKAQTQTNVGTVFTFGSVNPFAGHQVAIRGAFAAPVGEANAARFFLDGLLTAPTSGASQYLTGARLAATITTSASAEAHALAAQLILVEPVITVATGTVTDAATLIITGAPTEGTASNSALLIQAGSLDMRVGPITFGAIPSVSGDIRLSNLGSITMRDSADAVDLVMMRMVSTDNMEIGDANWTNINVLNSMAITGNLSASSTGSTNAFSISQPSMTVLSVDTLDGQEGVKLGGPAGLRITGDEVSGGGSSQSEHINNTVLSGTLSGASVTISAAIPAGTRLIGVTVRVKTTITGATSYDVGDGTDVDRWGATLPLSATNTTTIADYTNTGVFEKIYYPTAGDVVLTANGSNFTGGEIRVNVHYVNIIAALD